MKGFILPCALLGLLAYGSAQTTSVRSTAKSSGGSASKSKSPVKTAAKKTVAKRKAVRPAPPVDPTIGDNIDGDDLTVRRAAVAALGTMNGSVVVADPMTGRILTIVNQKLAYQHGFTPCSTIKLVTSLAALNEHVVDRSEFIRTSRYSSHTLTTAIAKSDNPYFAILGNRLGFDRVMRYAQLLGLGEKASLNIDREQAGLVPAEAPKWGGMGMLTSFGEGFLVTPLELVALVSAISNGGTLYYLQYPKSPDEVESFKPQVKRTLEFSASGFEDLRWGMRSAVDYGTAKRANYDPAEHIFGKTGTCTDFRVSTHMGWFGSYIQGPRPVAVAVMLTGTKTVNGPVASGVAGAFYRGLAEQLWYSSNVPPAKPKDGLPELITAYPRN